MSDAHAEGRGLVQVTVGPLRAVRSRTRNWKGIIGSFSSALHAEGRLALSVDVWVGASVLSRSRRPGEIFRGSSDEPSAREAVTGAGRFVWNLRAQQMRKGVAGRIKTETVHL